MRAREVVRNILVCSVRCRKQERCPLYLLIKDCSLGEKGVRGNKGHSVSQQVFLHSLISSAAAPQLSAGYRKCCLRKPNSTKRDMGFT